VGQKLHKLVKKTEGILGVKTPNILHHCFELIMNLVVNMHDKPSD
jgi:hypothetical protein